MLGCYDGGGESGRREPHYGGIFVADAELQPVMGSQCRLHRMGMMRSQERDRVRRWAAENL